MFAPRHMNICMFACGCMWHLEAEVRNHLLFFHLIHEAAPLNQARAFR
ncbi:hypothetical protein LEMLEM_LOCUS12735 [Lemmus lemmus]